MRSPIFVLTALLVCSILGLFAFVGPVAQDPDYHRYADQRVVFGIPFFWNVISNLPMFFIGLYGFRRASRGWSSRPAGAPRWIPAVLSVGIFITCFGSMYYHWSPDNSTLLWDRLPMTLMFMSLFSLVIFDFLGARAGNFCFWFSLPIGVASVLFWHFSEAAGQGDLRPYALVQFFPMLATVVLIVFFSKKVGYVRLLLQILFWYAIAKICEKFDHEIFRLLSGFWSGHTLKHFLGAVSLVFAVRLLDVWQPQATKN